MIKSSILQAQPTPSHSPNIIIDQFGYLPGMEKIAIIKNPITGYDNGQTFSPGQIYEVRDCQTNIAVYGGSLSSWNNGNTHSQSGDQVWWFDFSTITIDGEYYIYDVSNNVRSYCFEIDDAVYHEVLEMAFKVFYYQRCNSPKVTPYAETGFTDANNFVGTEQDADCRLVSNPVASTSKDLTGGWFDAGDYNKYINFADGPIHDLLNAYTINPIIWNDNMNIPESGNSVPDILDEIKYELDWFLKMQNADGSVLHKISNTTFNAASPPSADTEVRRYAPATQSATASACGALAHAAIVFKTIPSLTTYATTLENAAIDAWGWLVANPGYSNYNNAGFVNVAAEESNYDQDASKFQAAVYLFALTDDNTYKSFVDTEWANIHLNQWNYAYIFENHYQEAALYYASLDNATSAIASEMESDYANSIDSNGDNYPAIIAQNDAYRAYLTDNNHTWGSNRNKAQKGSLFHNMVKYNLGSYPESDYQSAASGYLHYINGVNPQGMVYLTNMNAKGAENSANEMYHSWFSNGSADWDRVGVSTYGPAPGFVTGGVNPGFAPDASYGGTISPPQGQPILKSYKDWNTSYPENSWEITEPAIYYQSAYIKLLASLIPVITLPVELIEFNAVLDESEKVQLNWTTASEENSDYFSIEKSYDGISFFELSTVNAKGSSLSPSNYFHWDLNPKIGYNYYRLKMVDKDGSYEYSKTETVYLQGQKSIVYPNPVTDVIYLSNDGMDISDCQYSIMDLSGKEVQRGNIPDNGQLYLNEKIQNGLFIFNLMKNGISIQKEKILVLKD